MMSRNEALERSIDPITPGSPLRDCVRRALCVRRARLHAIVSAAGIASVTPLALGAPFPPVFPLESLYPAAGGDGKFGFVLTGINTSDYSGWSVSAAGDVNGDGIDDLIIGAPSDPRRDLDTGESYVVFGSTQGFPPVMPLESLYPAGGGDGSRGFVLTGVKDGDGAGWSVNAAGDVNGDGIDDLIVGAPYADSNGDPRSGESYVVFGSTQAFPAVLPLQSLLRGDGSRGFVLSGSAAGEGAKSGYAVSGAGDVNGDGIDDLIVAAPETGQYYDYVGGRTFVVFGRNDFPAVVALAGLLNGGRDDGFVLMGRGEHYYTAQSVSTAGDVNGDGIDDLIVGFPFADPAGGVSYSYAGESYVVFGSTQGFPTQFHLASLYPPGGGDGSRGFVLPGIAENDHSGASVSAAGDINVDGIDDVIVGSPGSSEGYVVFGSTQPFPAVLPLESLRPVGGGDGSRGFVLTGIQYDGAGDSVSGAGDVNADGIPDLIVGAPGAHPQGHPGAGASYVVFGSMQDFPTVFPLSSLYPPGGGDGSHGSVLTGLGGASGSSVSDAGDVNGDGIGDLIIGAWIADSGGQRRFTGTSYVVFGRAAAP